MKAFLRILPVIGLLAIAATASAQARVLLPIYLQHDVPGAHGSLWRTEFAVHNSSGADFLIDSCLYIEGAPCDAVDNFNEHLLAGETRTALPPRYLAQFDTSHGAIVVVKPWGIPTVPLNGNPISFQLRVHDVSRADLNAGTELPVVPEPSFRQSTLTILDVPVDASFRELLRVYETHLEHAEFTVRVYDQSTNTLLHEQHLTTDAPMELTDPAIEFADRFVPGYAELTGVFSEPDGSRLRIEVEPLTEGSKFWAFVSVTNDVTQHVTLVTPQ
jgi:hypothetical protein